MEKKFAVFDVDGTLLEMAVPTDFILWLVEKNRFPNKTVKEIKKIIKLHEAGKISWKERGYKVLHFWAKGFKGKKKAEIQMLAEEFMKEYNKIFLGSIEVMNYLKKEGYYLIAVSRSFEEILKALKLKLPFDFVVGTKFEVKKGIFTGKLENRMWEHKIKKQVLMELIKEKNFSLEKSFAFGDSEQDSHMMKLVEFPVCVNSSFELKRIAEKNNWKTFNSIQDFFFELKKKGIQNLNLKK